MRKHLVRIALGLALAVLLLLLHGHHLWPLTLIDKLDAMIYDVRLRRTMPRDLDPRIVILDIDEKSLVEREHGGEGRWPWPRDRLALLLDKLFDHYKVAVVGFDVVFAESDSSSGIRVLESLGANELKDVSQFQTAFSRLKPNLDYDQLFANAMKNRPVVLGYTFLLEERKKGLLPPPDFTRAHLGSLKKPPFEPFKGYSGNLAMLQKAAASAGHFNAILDPDGIVRRAPILARYEDGYYEPLSLAVVRLLYGSPPLRIEIAEKSVWTADARLKALQIGSFKVPLDENGAALVPFRSPGNSFEYHSLVDVINGRVAVADLRGKIALIGATTPGLLDLRPTPVEAVYPGVEIHANLIAGILDQTIPRKHPYTHRAESVWVLLLGLALALLLPVLAPHTAVLVTAGIFLLVLVINVAVFRYTHIVLPLATTLVMILTLFTFNMAYGFFVVTRERRQITGLFGQYVPREVVDKLAENPERASMEGESREMTVLFTDVRGFTTISEGLDPKALSQLMNEFLTPLTEVIYKHGGTIDKYMGDCIMAFWGAPLPDPNHACNGVLAGLEMQRKLRELQPHFDSKKWPPIRIGVGLNSGRMSVGNMGSQVRLAYTVLGDAVNIAARLEGLTKEYGADIIVGEDTKNAAPGIVFKEIDRVRVKGKDTAVTIFEPLGREGEVTQAMLDEANLFREALELYRDQNWGPACQRLAELRKLAPQALLYDKFLERIESFRANPPGANWDGAVTFQTK